MISIIIPLYNTADLIKRCLDAILQQDYQGEYEVIVVDDGSTDDSYAIAETYEKSGRIKLYTKPNGGPASARNFGIDYCSPQSEWVTFIDSDDYVEPSFLSSLTSLDGDLKICAPFPTYGEWRNNVYTGGEIMSFSNLNASRDFAAIFSTGVMCPFWNKIFSLDIIRKHNLKIRDVRILEDIEFIFRYVQYCNHVTWLNKRVYNYIRRPNSETAKVSEDMITNYIELHGNMQNWFDNSLSKYVDEFAYPQYFALIRRFIIRGDMSTPKKYIRHPMVRQAFKHHKCWSKGELTFHTLMKYGFFNIAKKIFIR